MTTSEWKEFLERYAAALMITDEEPEGGWPSPPPPATPEAIAATEKRLGVTLPPSLKAFYKAANGWPYNIGPYGFVYPLPVEEIVWLRDVNPKSGLLLTQDDAPTTWRDVSAVLDADGNLLSWEYGPPIPYDGPPPVDERDEMLLPCLVVTTEGEKAACWILDPQNVNAQGEWAVCSAEIVMGPGNWETDGFGALFRREVELFFDDAPLE